MNSLLDNPCTTLSNTGSYTSWTADFSNSRCNRTVNNSYTANISSTNGKFWDNNRNTWAGGNAINGCTRYNSLADRDVFYTLGFNLNLFGINLTCKEYSYNYNCLLGGTLSSSTCTKIDTEYKAFSSF